MFEKTFEPSDAAVERETERRREADRSKTAQNEARSFLRDQRILEWWNERWYMNFIGLFVAILSVYFAGRLLGGLLGRSLYSKIERLLTTIPVVKQVYPYVKQVVDFILSDEKPIKFNRVVLVQYPRKDIWSIGLVTGTPMKSVQNQMDSNAKEPGITVFIPSSPTPFTGYTISVTMDEVVEIPISIDEALRFTITGGVLIPDRETIPPSIKSNEAMHPMHFRSDSEGHDLHPSSLRVTVRRPNRPIRSTLAPSLALAPPRSESVQKHQEYTHETPRNSH